MDKATLSLSPDSRIALQKGKAYFALLNDPRKLDPTITPVPGLPGALCYDTGIPGKSAALVAGTHMNELAGFSAAADFHWRWTEGFRPPSGKVYILAGGDVETIRNNFDRLLAEPPAITEGEFLRSRSQIIRDGKPSGVTFNHNMLPLSFRDQPDALKAKEPLYERVQKLTQLLGSCDAGVLDIHTTSQPSEPTASPFTRQGDNEQAVIAKLAPVTRNMPLQFITLFQEHQLLSYQPGDAAYPKVELPLRAFAPVGDDAVSLLVETGQHLDSRAFSNAVEMERAWLKNVIGMPAHVQAQKPEEHVTVVGDIHKIFHPSVLRGEARTALPAEVVDDHYFLIHDTGMLRHGPANGFEWSAAAKEKIAGYQEQHLFGERAQERLSFFAPVKQGEVLAIGLNTGHAVTADADGYLLMVNKNPDLSSEQDNFGYLGTAAQIAADKQPARPPSQWKL